MVGLELNINEKIIKVATGKRSLSIILNKIGGEITLQFSSVDFEKDESICWYESTLKLGDKFCVIVKDIIQDSSQSVEIKKVYAPSTWTSEQEKKQKQREVQLFLQLKELLLEKGLLK